MNLDPIMIDITTTPPTPEDMANKRREATAKKTAIARRRRVAIWVNVIVVLLTSLGFWITTGSVAGAAIPGAVVVSIAGVMAVAPPTGESVAWTMAVSAAAAAFVVGTVAFATEVFVAGSVVGALIMMLFVIYNDYLQNQIDQADKTLSALTELNADEYPNECIQYDSLRNNDPIIKQYHAGIVALERKPVMAELNAEKEWIDSADQRDKTNKAHQACERMMEA